MAKILESIKKVTTSFIMLVAGLALVGGLVYAPVTAEAQNNCQSNSNRTPNFGDNCVGGLNNVRGTREGIAEIVVRIVNFFIFILAAVSVGFIVYGGYLFVTDNGDGNNAGKGKKIVINAIIGLVVALISFTVVTLVVNFISTANIGTGT
jgi:hypothetical protein